MPSYAKWHKCHPLIGHNRPTWAKKSGAAVPHFFWGGGAGYPSNSRRLGHDLLPYKVASSPGHNGQGPKIGGCASLGEVDSHLIQCGRGEAYISTPSFVWIHPTVWPQYGTPYTNVRDRTTVR